ncbi:helix-turn-helix domain-containing protein [Nocardia huaxiensis]|uniref:Helix-turn-helix domain-containing protein n=1 Tax=Nocardia huaxiensis TaxID=2755382 RepID=A0A7D6ZT24_9NOCA|nr:helix-turn-helix domain-containing protein [Nocardia huaxiensis]QLY27969.1 helix-turn-helix domain-containing protein [Nocardia huaxiensis]
MSKFAIVPVHLISAPIEDRDFRTLVALLSYADREGNCDPTMPQLSKRTGKSDRTAKRSISRLKGAGAIEVSRRPNDSNAYKVHLESGWAIYGIGGATDEPVTAGCAKSDRPTVDPSGNGEAISAQAGVREDAPVGPPGGLTKEQTNKEIPKGISPIPTTAEELVPAIRQLAKDRNLTEHQVQRDWPEIGKWWDSNNVHQLTELYRETEERPLYEISAPTTWKGEWSQ